MSLSPGELNPQIRPELEANAMVVDFGLVEGFQDEGFKRIKLLSVLQFVRNRSGVTKENVIARLRSSRGDPDEIASLRSQ